MSQKIKVIGATLAAVMAFSAVAASAANAELAPHWRVNGTDLPNGATLNYTATLTGTATLSVPGLLTLVSENCSGHGKIVGSAAKVSGKGKESVLECEEIEVEGAPACEVFPVVTEPMKGELGWMEEHPATPNSNVATFEPEEVGGNFTTVFIEECALAGEYPVSGGTVGTLTPPEEEVLEGTLTLGGADATTTEHYFLGETVSAGNRKTKASPHLVFGGRAATFSGTFDVSLNPAEPVGIFPG